MNFKTLFNAFPWAHTETSLEKEHFDKTKVMIALRAKIKSIP
jgi:hypothetical protein